MKSKTLILFIAVFLVMKDLGAQKMTVVEIYLVDKISYIDTADKKNGMFFSCVENDLPQSPFISNEEIIGYEIFSDTSNAKSHREHYYLSLSKSGQNKIGKIKNIPLCCGRPFVITVNRKPIYGGYFWNPFSSFACAWITISAAASQDLEIERGLPYDCFTKNHIDPRCNIVLEKAFRQTGRLKKH